MCNPVVLYIIMEKKAITMKCQSEVIILCTRFKLTLQFLEEINSTKHVQDELMGINIYAIFSHVFFFFFFFRSIIQYKEYNEVTAHPKFNC